MAKLYENKKGFKVIQATRGEMMCALSEYGCAGICDSCGSCTSHDGFYIAVSQKNPTSGISKKFIHVQINPFLSRLSGFTARMPTSTGNGRLISHRKNQNEY